MLNSGSGASSNTDSMASTSIASSPDATSNQSVELAGSSSVAPSMIHVDNSGTADAAATLTTPQPTYVNRRDVEQCLKKIQELSVERRQRPETKSIARCRVRQQQQENQYRSDYNRAIPMIDGLVDMDISGTFLDIESCLLAQLYHFHGGDKETKEEGKEETRYQEMQPWQQHVWPNLRQTTFLFAGRCPGKLAV